MPNQLDSFSSFSSRPNSPLFVIMLVVIASHFALLGIGAFWKPALPTPKPRSKVLVQTIRLQPIQSDSIQNSTSLPAALPITAPLQADNLPIEQPKAEPLMPQP
jgi:hypothetical protein